MYRYIYIINILYFYSIIFRKSIRTCFVFSEYLTDGYH